MSFDQKKFNQFILDHDIIGIFDKPITLKSGRASHWYVNWRPITSDPFLLDLTTNFILSFVTNLNIDCDCFYGVPEGASKLGIITQFKYAKQQASFKKGSHVLPMGRSKPKLHGKLSDRFFVGEPKGKTVIIEDVTSTGGSLIESIEMLQENNIDVVASIGLTNRSEKQQNGQSVKDAIADRNIPYYEMSNAADLFEGYFNRHKISNIIKTQINDEFLKFSSKTLNI